MRRLVEELIKERESLRLQEKLQSEVQEKLAGAQRQFMLREQLKTIQPRRADRAGGSVPWHHQVAVRGRAPHAIRAEQP